jgi:hypothetical protein
VTFQAKMLAKPRNGILATCLRAGLSRSVLYNICGDFNCVNFPVNVCHVVTRDYASRKMKCVTML